MARRSKTEDNDWGEESNPAPRSEQKPQPKESENDPRFAGLEHLPEQEKQRRIKELDEHAMRVDLIRSQTLAMLTFQASELERNNPQLVAFIREDERAKVLSELGNGK